ncbi:hypothetical protein Sa4125_36200 [Aureimonas sp. SA4125]|nr:hypothetical protein Sa4125_36200 [Aureimonas sp. SA4125]
MIPAAYPSGRPALDLDLARTFVAICETGNFSTAAERVCRTPSAISLQVKRLEDMLGRMLFRREARSVTLTSDGEILLDYARRLLALSDEAVAHFLMPPMEGNGNYPPPHSVECQAPTVSRIVLKTLPPWRSRAVSTTVRMSASPSAAHMDR